MKVLTGFSCFGIRPNAGLLQHCNKHLVIIKDEEFFDYLNDYQLSKKNYAAWY